jgi:hypothetical protein
MPRGPFTFLPTSRRSQGFQVGLRALPSYVKYWCASWFGELNYSDQLQVFCGVQHKLCTVRLSAFAALRRRSPIGQPYQNDVLCHPWFRTLVSLCFATLVE